MPGLDRYPSMTGWNVVVTPVIKLYDRCHGILHSELPRMQNYNLIKRVHSADSEECVRAAGHNRTM